MKGLRVYQFAREFLGSKQTRLLKDFPPKGLRCEAICHAGTMNIQRGHEGCFRVRILIRNKILQRSDYKGDEGRRNNLSSLLNSGIQKNSNSLNRKEIAAYGSEFCRITDRLGKH